MSLICSPAFLRSLSPQRRTEGTAARLTMTLSKTSWTLRERRRTPGALPKCRNQRLVSIYQYATAPFSIHVSLLLEGIGRGFCHSKLSSSHTSCLPLSVAKLQIVLGSKMAEAGPATTTTTSDGGMGTKTISDPAQVFILFSLFFLHHRGCHLQISGFLLIRPGFYTAGSAILCLLISLLSPPSHLSRSQLSLSSAILSESSRYSIPSHASHHVNLIDCYWIHFLLKICTVPLMRVSLVSPRSDLSHSCLFYHLASLLHLSLTSPFG